MVHFGKQISKQINKNILLPLLSIFGKCFQMTLTLEQKKIPTKFFQIHDQLVLLLYNQLPKLVYLKKVVLQKFGIQKLALKKSRCRIKLKNLEW